MYICIVMYACVIQYTHIYPAHTKIVNKQFLSDKKNIVPLFRLD